MSNRADYLTALDPFPQQYEDGTKLWPFYAALREGRFTTTRCSSCSEMHWPPRSVCPVCMSDELVWEDQPTEATIYSFTVQVAGVPVGFKPPLVYALIDFDNGLRLFTAIVDSSPEEVSAGSRVRMVVRDVDVDQDGRQRQLPYFTLVR